MELGIRANSTSPGAFPDGVILGVGKKGRHIPKLRMALISNTLTIKRKHKSRRNPLNINREIVYLYYSFCIRGPPAPCGVSFKSTNSTSPKAPPARYLKPPPKRNPTLHGENNLCDLDLATQRGWGYPYGGSCKLYSTKMLRD